MDLADRDQRSRLLGAKLRWLLTESGLGGDPRPVDCPLGAAALADGRTWIMPAASRGAVDVGSCAALGSALLWALRHGCDAVGIVTDGDAGHLARMASHFDLDIDVRAVADERLVAVGIAAHLDAPMLDAAHRGLAEVIEAAGADVVVEHPLGGVPGSDSTVSGEVHGLEVCRVTGGGEPRLEIGTGVHDREAFAMVHAGRDAAEALAEVVGRVAVHRRPGAAPHPLNRLAVSRLMRARARAAPASVGAAHLEPVAPPEPRRNLLEETPCAASSGEEVLTFVAGVDPACVTFALDAAHRHGLPARIVIRDRDDHPALRRLAASARRAPVFTRLDP